MKKLIITIVFFANTIALISATRAVESNNLGLRVSRGFEASYQQSLGYSNRLEIDFGVDFDEGVNLVTIYQWVWDFSELGRGFNFYLGAGAGLAVGSGNFAPGGLGQIGLEYNFNIPLHLSFDLRPGAYYTDDDGFVFAGNGIALGLRYCF